MVAEQIILAWWYRVVMATAQEDELLRRQLEELNARMEDIRQQSATAVMNAAVRGLTNAVRTMGQSVARPRPEHMSVGKPEPYVHGKDFDDWDFTLKGYAGSLDPSYPALLKAARQSTTVVTATAPHEQQSATLLYLLTVLTQKGARTGLLMQIMTYKFGSRIEDVEDRLNEFLELVRRYDEANGTDPVLDQVQKACIFSNTPEPLKTHLQVERQQPWNIRCIACGNKGLLEEQTHLHDDLCWKHSRR